MPTASPNGYVTIPEGTDQVTRAAYAANLTEIDAALGNHVGVGGTTQHPAASDSEAGFMSSADKVRLDRLSLGGWRVRALLGAAVNNLTDWNANGSAKVVIAHPVSLGGELAWYSPNEVNPRTERFSQRITVDDDSQALTIPVLANDEGLYGVAVKVADASTYSLGSFAGSGQGYSRNLTGTLGTAGDYVIHLFLLNTSSEAQLVVGEWYVTGVAWAGYE